MQTGTGLPLNVFSFSWMSLAPDTAGAAAVNNNAGTMFGHCRQPRHCAATGAMAVAVEWAALMHSVYEVVVLLGGGGVCGRQ